MSARPSLIVRHLEIRRTPGIRSPYAIQDLCAGINIVHGPNASGKTTTAQAVQMLLWNSMDGWSRASLSGWIDLEGSEWFVDFDAGALCIQRDGGDATRLPIAGAEHRDRYVLTLHDLLQADNADFAEIILRESTGGYDTDAARDQLGYDFPSGRPNSRTRDSQNALNRVREGETAQRALAQEQQNLSLVRERLERAREAMAHADVLRRVIAARDKADELELARQRVDGFPDGMSRLAGDELDRLNEIREQIAEYEQRRRRNEGDIQSARETRARTGLVGIDQPSRLVALLRERCQKLQDIAQDLSRAEGDLAVARSHRERYRRTLGELATDEQLAAFEIDGLRQLAEVAWRLSKARANQTAVEDLHSWIGNVEAPQNLGQLEQGISYLNGWLRTSAAPAGSLDDSRQKAMLWLIAGLTVIETVALGFVVHWMLLLILLPVVVLLVILANRPGKGAASASGADRAAFFQREYSHLEIEQPRSWKVDEVERLANRLVARYREASVEHEKAQRWASLQERREGAACHLEEIESEWRELAARYGISEPDPARLDLLAQNLDRWQEADSRVRAGERRVDLERQRHRDLLRDINRDLSLAGYEEAVDHATALAYTEDLGRRVQEFNHATSTITAARRALDEDICPEIERLEEQQRTLFAALGLEDGDDLTLKSWLDRLDEYREAVNECQRAELALRNAELELDAAAALISRDRAELEADLREIEERAAEYDELHKTIIETEARVNDAKRAHVLEDALADLERTRDILREEREDAYRKAAGWMLADFVRRQTRDRDRPAVFHRARELFASITQGRYELQFVDDPEPVFSATDTTTGMSHSLDELSSATRVQLLMAVRIAFVEEMETGPRLPLILDETLANADEHRAEAIIAAACQISRSGRQIFYFTAQHDEVKKWVHFLQYHPDIPRFVVSLAEARELPEFEPSFLADLEHTPPPSVPAPDGADRVEYGRVLGVPAIDPSQDVGAVHLWYLIEDTGELHRQLSLGISTWGQLRTLVKFGGNDLTAPEVFGRALARARVLEAAFQGWRVGQSRPVDRAAVLDSNAFTPAFRDRVIREALRVEGDAERLLRALEAGRVSRLRHDSIKTFRHYLIEHGYLATSEPLTMGELRARVLGAAGDDIAAGRITIADVDEMLRYLPPREGESE